MDYNDYTILSDNEYIKLAALYNQQNPTTPNNLLEQTYIHISNCQNCLYLSNSFKNHKIKNELNKHLTVLNKLKDNFNIFFPTKRNNINKINNFNIFEYLTNLIKLNINLNNLVNTDLKNVNRILIKPFIKDIELLIFSLLNILSTLNIHIFNYM